MVDLLDLESILDDVTKQEQPKESGHSISGLPMF